MSDSKSPRSPPNRKPLDAVVPGRPVAAGIPGGVERRAVPRPPARPGASRHSAITRNLQNYASYKLWAEKVRSSWEPGKDPKG
ncbi:MAG TPA: hypothetical protein VMT92_07370 [Steroidobacteraceae bacterium]|jgi:hypothetical protein|nr:hypothetical protein [Steroidobacteraceae bacterium]